MAKNQKKYDFGGWATKFNIKCADGRTIKKEAFAHCDGMVVPLVFNHDHKDINAVLGNCELQHRDEGVYAYCSFNNTEDAKNAKEMVTHGDIAALSIYANHLTQKGDDVIHGDIREVSLVLAGANPGALIDNPIMHSENGTTSVDSDSATIYHDDEEITLDVVRHSEENPEKEPKPEEEQPNNVDANQNPAEEKPAATNPEEPKPEEVVEHSAKGDETVKTVFEGAMKKLNKKEQTVIYGVIGAASNLSKEEPAMGHNAFEQNEQKNENVLAHSDLSDVLSVAMKGGSLKEAYQAKCEEKKVDVKHSITDIENLFPEVQPVNKEPMVLDIEHNWVAKVMSRVHRTPFAKIKSTYANLTAAEARAKGYVKGNEKVDEVITAAKRTTHPTTIYKKQALDRDDIIDITDFDVVIWIKKEMKIKLEEEVARAILVGDGRSAESDDKISESSVRPIATDNNLYTITRSLGNAASTKQELAALLVDDSVRSMEVYKGSGNTTMFVRRDIMSEMVLLKDLNQRRIYKDVKELATAMMVNDIVDVPTEIMGDTLALYIDLKDYNVGMNKGGQTNFFSDFDIDFNKEKYLLETRLSGANIKPKSAVVFVKGTAEAE